MSMAAGLHDKPRLTRDGPAPIAGIVHIGPGAFFRAHAAIYTDDAIKASGGDWGIAAVSLRSATARNQLDPQDGLFTSIEKAPDGDKYRTIGSISQVLVAPEDPEAVVALMADPKIRIVSLTITEKGYCHNPSTGRLDLEHEDIVHDLCTGSAWVSAPGFLVEALARRRASGTTPFTVLSCDNLPSNGKLTRQIILDFARQRDEDLAQWIAAEVPFPSTMVDRITPASTEEDLAQLADVKGYFDPACVVHEPFRQWVIEDNFAAGCPAWEAGGAQFVKDVEAHELMKLRCLNGTHSALAYLGYLAGYETISDAVADDDFSNLCKRLWADEIVPTVPEPEGEDLRSYTDALLARYRNPAIRHRTWQIAMDGSQKLPQRILGTISDNLATGNTPKGLCLVVAAWMRYVGGIDEQGSQIDVRDPLADRLKAAFQSAATPAGKVANLIAVREVFDPALAKNSDFATTVASALETLLEHGAKAAVAGYSD